MAFGSNKTVKTKQPHSCFSCFRIFPVGTLMDKWSWFFDSWNRGYTCTTCVEIHNLDKSDFYDGIPEGYVHECLEEYQTPEQYLEEQKLLLTTAKNAV